ncbi:unnamed protein product [Schistocephalus solidus]|uniref:Homeobox domain-containing protein n=1 Tax=Schistocephalus solidus TaxID=70667 RepID=A0A3P7E2I2_SCHSO|nr:unnamed protein product [Schistocephalus solidus]
MPEISCPTLHDHMKDYTTQNPPINPGLPFSQPLTVQRTPGNMTDQLGTRLLGEKSDGFGDQLRRSSLPYLLERPLDEVETSFYGRPNRLPPCDVLKAAKLRRPAHSNCSTCLCLDLCPPSACSSSCSWSYEPQYPCRGGALHGIPVGLEGPRRKNATREKIATLKTWLQDHATNPYPTKGEKIMLAIVTKMTFNQISTWFANARRRLKKEKKMTWTPRLFSASSSSGGITALQKCAKFRSLKVDSGSNNRLKEEDEGEEEEEEDDDDEEEEDGEDEEEEEKKWLNEDQKPVRASCSSEEFYSSPRQQEVWQLDNYDAYGLTEGVNAPTATCDRSASFMRPLTHPGGISCNTHRDLPPPANSSDPYQQAQILPAFSPYWYNDTISAKGTIFNQSLTSSLWPGTSLLDYRSMHLSPYRTFEGERLS